MHFYLAQWAWFDDGTGFAWRAPDSAAVGVLDLRSLPQMAAAGGVPEGWGLFAFGSTADIPGTLYLGQDLRGDLLLRDVNDIQRRLGVSLSFRKPGRIIRQLLLDPSCCDPTGQTRHKPIRLDRRRRLRMRFAREDIAETEDAGEIGTAHPAFARTLDVRIADYRQMRAAGESIDTLRKWTGYEMRRLFGRVGDDLLAALVPPEFVDDGWREPETTITESFDQADGTTLGPDLTWTETSGDWSTLGNTATVGNESVDRFARAESALSGTDHYAQVDYVSRGGSSNFSRFGTAVRFAAGEETCYYCYHQWNGAIKIFKRITGTPTELAADTLTIPTLPFSIRTVADGSDIDMQEDLVSVLSVDDTSITAGLLTGVMAARQAQGDDFEASDLGGGGGSIELVLADASHGHTADNITLTQSNVLAVQDATHGHAAEAPTLSQAVALTVSDASHAHSAESVALTQANELAVADAAHAHATDAVALVQANMLAIADALHVHAADAVALTQANVLAPADALHGHAAESPVLTIAGALAVADALHAHSAESPALVQASILVVLDALHGHTADNVVLTEAQLLAVANALHGHAAESPTIAFGALLAVADALHAHAADGLALTQAVALAVADALHTHTAGDPFSTFLTPAKITLSASYGLKFSLTAEVPADSPLAGSTDARTPLTGVH